MVVLDLDRIHRHLAEESYETLGFDRRLFCALAVFAISDVFTLPADFGRRLVAELTKGMRQLLNPLTPWMLPM
ncbi:MULTISPECIES: hypothetical protein [Sinorhizobium]|uniref:Uncharacterized protein n=1 Tax=Sinorhizobium americanum TaxID=194963 RepID=A0A2S3YRG5_9HYPH|nr:MULTISPECIES: hypothetical protein [Sinorhizobium]PDT43222.1 hypothetical protein CO656_00530 [Sinorhizobium sp. FG01]POH34227.1 hypothetical protein ATY31_07085 [Sinorhizobium americanum]